jgi:D-alanyl-D-alanine carboxypeptidase
VVGGASGPTAPSSDTPWTIDTVSAIGSVTKSFTAVVIMQLVEEGRLSLDDTIGTWFPDQPNADRITVRMLLSHTSGLANYISAENVMDPKWTEEWVPSDLIGEANRLGPVREPGGNSAYYANTNYIVLGLIVEAITGNRWAEEVRSRIIEPLHLEDTGFIGEEGIWGGVMVDGYSKAVEGYHRVQDSPYPHPSTSGSAGVMVSSVADLMTFASALVDGELVSEETLAEMATPLGTDADNGVVWGLGLLTVESLPGVFAMEGGIPGYNAFVVGDLERKILVVTLVNTEEGDAIGPSLMALDYVRSMVPPE